MSMGLPPTPRLRRESKPSPPDYGNSKKTRTLSPGTNLSNLRPFSMVVKQSLANSADTASTTKDDILHENETSDDATTESTHEHDSHTSTTNPIVLSLAEEDMLAMSNSVCQYIMANISTIMAPLLSQLKDDMFEALRSANEEIATLRAENATLKDKLDELDQRNRRNNIRISGLKESPDVEEEGQLIEYVKNELAVTGIEINTSDIDDVYRAGEKRKDRVRPIVVKFTNQLTRAKVASFQYRSKLPEGVFINDDLTRKRSNLLYRARCLVKSRVLEKAWSAGGCIFVRDRRGTKHRIANDEALDMLKSSDTGVYE